MTEPFVLSFLNITFEIWVSDNMEYVNTKSAGSPVTTSYYMPQLLGISNPKISKFQLPLKLNYSTKERKWGREFYILVEDNSVTHFIGGPKWKWPNKGLFSNLLNYYQLNSVELPFSNIQPLALYVLVDRYIVYDTLINLGLFNDAWNVLTVCRI